MLPKTIRQAMAAPLRAPARPLRVVRTLVVSDLHLGAARAPTCCAAPGACERADGRARDGVERLVLLGDTLELRQGPLREALGGGAPVLREARRGARRGRRDRLVPGNHDHALVAPWLERRHRDGAAALAGSPRPRDGSPSDAGRRARARRRRRRGSTLAYPGVLAARRRLRACMVTTSTVHTTVPTLRAPRAPALMARLVGAPPERGALTDDYERVLAPIYAWSTALARTPTTPRPARRPLGQALWRTLAGARAPRRCGGARWSRCSRSRSRRSTVPGSGRCAPTSRAGAAAAPARGDGGGGRAPRDRRRARAVRPHAPHRAAARSTTSPSGPRRRRAAAQHRLLGLRARRSSRHAYESPTGRARRSASRERAAAAACARARRQSAAASSDRRRRPTDARGASPGVKQTAWQVTPSPTSSSSTPARVALVLDERVARRVLDGELAPLAVTRPRRTARPTPAGLVGAAVGAGLVRRLRRRSARRARPRDARGASGSRSTPSSSWIASSVSA